MIRRFLAILHARNMEFLRDRSALSWNIVLPVLLVFGLAVIFTGFQRPLFKVAVLQAGPTLDRSAHPFLKTQYVDFFEVRDQQRFVHEVGRYQVDMLLDLRAHRHPRYWINPENPRGYILEKLLLAASGAQAPQRETASGQRIRYIDWLLPGVLAMNMMFSCLFGVGYVVVRYRKNGFLKRLQATPLRALEFAAAQVASRLLLILAITAAVYAGTDYLVGFHMAGSYAVLLLAAVLGAVSMISLGLVVAARVTSEELASGLLNLISWPMMLLSGVWFSLEGANPLLQKAAQLLPLTQLLEAARGIMLEGKGLIQVAPHLAALAAMSVVFLGTGAAIFRWRVH